MMRHTAIALAGLMLVLPGLAQADNRSEISLDKDWQLYPMPDFQMWSPEPRLTAIQIQQLNCPAAGKGWHPVQLPDDYVVRGEFSPEPNASMLAGGAVCPLGGRECEQPNGAKPAGSPGALNRPGRNAYAGHGYLPVYPAWYRRNVTIPASAQGKSVWLDFGGVYRDAVVFVNGRFIHQHASGYTAFRLNITSAVRYGEDNIVTVFVDPRWFEGWWYEGGGIYRHVSLVITDRLQVSPWGTFVEAKVPGPIHYGTPSGDRATARLTIQTTVGNGYLRDRKFTIESRVIDTTGRTVASASSSVELTSGEEGTFSQNVDAPDALLWSPEHANLYTLSTTIRLGNAAVDRQLTTFGVRTIGFDADHGFFLNGRHVEIHGVCSHHDFPGVGIGAPDNLWSWRIAKLQAMGANAYRCAHNPASEAFYQAADRMGMLVMDENRHLGDTYFPKTVEGTSFSDLTDVQDLVLQHRNHPSIIMWSLCNEEGEGKKPFGARVFAAMQQAVMRIDPTRPTTGGINGGYTKEGYISVEDILGMNYHNPEFAKVHSTFPRLMIFGSEDTNAKTSRGTPETSRSTGLCSQYGGTAEPACDGQPWISWIPTVKNPFVAGQFIWTGFDYRGEPNPFSWPAVTSQTGAMDLCGFPKPVYYYWKTAWHDQPSVHIFPDWNFPKTMVGQTVRVRSFSNCDRVELLLNGKSLGVQDMPGDLYLDWQVPYAPGTLTAIASNKGREAARDTLQTTGLANALRLISQFPRVTANGEDIAPIEVAVVDADGRVVPDADPLIQFSIAGAGTLAGVANGDPASHESNVGDRRRAFRGLAMVLVRSTDRAGSITIQAQAPGLRPASLVIRSVPDVR